MANARSGTDRCLSIAAKAPERRTVVLEGTFSIEEIDVNPRSGKATTKSGRKRSGKTTVRKKAPAKKIRAKKAAAKNPARKQAGDVNELRGKATPAVATAAEAPAATVVLDSHHDIKTIRELRERLDTAYAAGGDIVLDGAAVESMDTAALQLLLAFGNSVRKQSRTLRWSEVSAAMRALAERTDLGAALEFPDGSDEDDGLCPVF